MGLIAIGDIHGCAATLDVLLARLAPTSDDHLVFVGDYVDRGPDSCGVINRLMGLRETHRCTFLRGNHEALMLDCYDYADCELWHANGGIATLQSYRTERRSVFEAHVAFIRETVSYYDTPDFFFVHAGLDPARTIAENVSLFDDEVFLWERSHLQVKEPPWEKPVVCGHTPHMEPLVRDRLLVIDTGCVYYNRPGFGRLTAIRLPERALVSVDYVG